jgi:hypothetical protein
MLRIALWGAGNVIYLLSLHENFFTPHYSTHRAILGAGILFFLIFNK